MIKLINLIRNLYLRILIINSKENFNNDPCIFCNRLFETNNKQ